VINMHFPPTKKILVSNPRQAVMDFIHEHFDLCLPFEVHPGYEFQIRLKAKDFKKLSKREQDKLRLYQKYRSYTHDERKSLAELLGSEEAAKAYIETNYWKNCDAYVFDYESANSLKLELKCQYGYEGLDESITYVFIDKDEFDPIIIANMGLNERGKWKKVKEDKK